MSRRYRANVALAWQPGRGALAAPAPETEVETTQAPAPPPVSAELRVERQASFGRVERSVLYIGFVSYVFAITTYQFPIGQLSISLALLGLLVQKQALRFPPLLVGFTLFLAWCGVGVLHSRWPSLVSQEWIEFSKLGLIVLAAANALRSWSQIRFFVVFWVVCYVMYPVRGSFMNYFVYRYNTFGRALWNHIFGNPNDLAALTLLQLGLAAGLLVTEKGWIWRGALAATLLNTLLVFMTQSRAGFLGLAVFGLLAVLGSRQRLRAMVLAGVLGVVVALAAPPEVWTRIRGLSNATSTETLSEVDEEGSAAQRFAIWQTAFLIVRDHPLTGVGWGTYPLANNLYAPRDGSGPTGLRLGPRDTHSTYFNVLAELGYPGLALFLALIVGSMLHTGRVRRRVRDQLPRVAQQMYLMQLGLIGFLVAAVFGSFSRLSFLYLYLVVMYAIAEAASSEMRAAPRGATPGRR